MQRVCSADQSVLACVVCGQFPVNVVETQCNPQCSPLYCWECVARLDRCVMCATTIDTEKLRPLPFIRQRLSMLNVRCRNEGCNAVFKSGERDKHERECEAALTKCSVSDKCAPIPRSHVLAHESECPNRLIACPELCGERVLAQGLQAHIDACAAKLVACRQGKCDVEELLAHQAVCPHRHVVCPVAALGCGFKGAANELERHLKHDVQHWEYFTATVASLQARVSDLGERPPATPPSSHLEAFIALGTGILVWLFGLLLIRTGVGSAVCLAIVMICSALLTAPTPTSPLGALRIYRLVCLGALVCIGVGHMGHLTQLWVLASCAFCARLMCRGFLLARESKVTSPVDTSCAGRSPVAAPLACAQLGSPSSAGPPVTRTGSGKKGV